MTTFIMLGMIVVAPKAIAAIGPKKTLVVGMTILTVGLAGLSLIRSDGSFWVDVLPASLIAAAGMSLAFIPSLGIALSSARPGGGRAGLRDREHQLPDRLRPRPCSDDRRGRRERRRPARRRRLAHDPATQPPSSAPR